jgi:POT family proton-dependent oligopeptide transporter
MVVIAFAVLPHAAYSMIWNIGLIFIDAQVSLATPVGTVPTAWFNSVDSFASIVAVPPLVALWAWQARRDREPASIAKIGIGSAIIGASALFFVAGCLLAGPNEKVSVVWPLLAFTGMGVGFLYYWPVLLALVSQAAPTRINSTMMGVAFLALFVASLLMGWVGSFYDEMSPAAFWTVDAAMGLGGALIVLILNRPLSRALEPRADG